MSLKRCSVSDLMGPLTQRVVTPEGYLVSSGNLSKAGNVQEYSARELGLDVPGMDANRIIRMYRPSDEVFKPAALKSFDAKPMTLSHPGEPVTSLTWKGVAVGEVTNIAADSSGNYMTGTLTVRDHAAIDAIVDGTSQLSCGYSFDADMTPGSTADGQEYDGCMRDISGNHLAIVDAARGGPGCRVADSRTTHPTGERTMAIRKLTIDKIPLELEDNQASLVEKIVSDARAALDTANASIVTATKRASDAETAVAGALEANKKLVADHAAEIAVLKAQIPTAEQLAALNTVAKVATDHAAEVARLKALVPTAEKIEQLAVQYAKVVADAKAVISTFDAAGKTLPAIRSEVLELVIASNDSLKHIANAALSGIEPSKAAEEIVRIAFDAVVAAKGVAPAAAGGGVDDPEVARQLVGDRTNPAAAGARRKPVSGYDLMRFRERNGGKDPNKVTA